jgi:uncharacterized lipoprotein NlpE involved in copper resistance
MNRIVGMVLVGLALSACSKSRDDGHSHTVTAVETAQAAVSRPSVTRQELPLPANFRGTIPCDDCRGIDTYLELRSDHSYLLEERFLGRNDNNSQRTYSMGHFSQNGDLLRLQARTEPARLFRVHTPKKLQVLNAQGKPEGRGLLTSSDQQLLPTGRLILRGHYVFSDDQGFFRECETNHSWPVATAGDSEALDAQYQALTGSPSAIVFARLEAHLAHQPNGTGTDSEEALVVDRVINLNISEDCTTARP